MNNILPESLQDFDALGDYCKNFERIEAGRKMDSLDPSDKNRVLLARLDGRSFSTVTRYAKRPLDPMVKTTMVDCARALVRDFHADFAYTQSDEISLGWTLKRPESQFPFGGKFAKINSILAAQCSVDFNTLYGPILKLNFVEKSALFDCRSWSVANKVEATRAIIWRQKDAQKNCISSVAHHLFGHNKIEKVGTNKRLEMIKESGFDWDGLDDGYKMGMFIQPTSATVVLSEEELLKIPEKHRPTGAIQRTKYIESFFPLADLPNPVWALFGSED